MGNKDAKKGNKDSKSENSISKDAFTKAESDLIDKATQGFQSEQKKEELKQESDKNPSKSLDDDEFEDEPVITPISNTPIINTKIPESQTNAMSEKTIIPKTNSSNNTPSFSSPIPSIPPPPVPLAPLVSDINTYENDKNFSENLKRIKSNIKQKTKEKIKTPIEKNNQSLQTQKQQREQDYEIPINIKINNKIEQRKVRPYIDKAFAFVCQGYDRIKKRPCYRFLKDLTYNQAIQFEKFIKKYGCICDEHLSHEITLTTVIEELFKSLPFEPMLYENEFILEYSKRLSFATIVSPSEDEEDHLLSQLHEYDKETKDTDEIEDAKKDDEETKLSEEDEETE